MKKTVDIKGVVYELADSRTLVDVTTDLYWHGGRWTSESWFIVANLRSGTERIGLQVHVLVNDIPQHGSVASINVSLINEATGWYKSFEYMYPAEKISLGRDAFNIQAPKFSFSGNGEAISTYVEIDGATIDIVSSAAAPVLLMNGLGYVEFLGVEQYDYAFPRMATKGIITIDGKQYEVEGLGWFDRQWGVLPDFFADPGKGSFNSMQWLWVNPQLSNGINMSIGQIKEFDKKRLTSGATCTQPDGTHIITSIEPIEEVEYWTSPATGNKYPTKIVVRAPGVDSTLTIEVPFKEQEIISKVGGVTKFEGAATVTGTYEGQSVNGDCYLELVGYWK